MNDDEFTRPYRRIAAAEESLERNALLDYYVKLYKQKYRAEPIFPITAVTQTQIKDLQRIMKDKAYATLTAYFQISDKWFEQQQYSLDCLLKNLSKVNVQIQKLDNTQKLKGKLKMQFHCDSCWQEFTLICAPDYDFLNVLVRCEPCTAANRPLKKISKEERRATVLKLGNAFPDVPWDTKRKEMLDEINELNNSDSSSKENGLQDVPF